MGTAPYQETTPVFLPAPPATASPSSIAIFPAVLPTCDEPSSIFSSVFVGVEEEALRGRRRNLEGCAYSGEGATIAESRKPQPAAIIVSLFLCSSECSRRAGECDAPYQREREEERAPVEAPAIQKSFPASVSASGSRIPAGNLLRRLMHLVFHPSFSCWVLLAEPCYPLCTFDGRCHHRRSPAVHSHHHHRHSCCYSTA